MTRIAFVSDNHFEADNRLEDTVRIHDWIAGDCAERGVDLVVLGGDLFEKKSVPEDRNAAAAWLRKMADLAPVVGVQGNHESPGDLDIFNHLDARHPITIYNRPAVHYEAGVAIACLPWPRKANLLASVGDVGMEQARQLATDALRNVIRGLGHQLAEFDGPRIALAHVMIDGAETDHDQPLIGADMAVSLADLGLFEADFVACGHVHAQNEWEWNGTPIVYAGGPRHRTFGEFGPKGYVVIGADPDRCGLSWERVATPTAPMLLIEGELVDEDCPESGESFRALRVSDNPSDVTGAEIRLRYRVDADEAEQAKHEAAGWKKGWLGRGAAAVKLDPIVRSTTRARVPEITGATKLEDKLAALWKARNDEPEKERRQVLVAKAHQLEEEVRDAS